MSTVTHTAITPPGLSNPFMVTQRANTMFTKYLFLALLSFWACLASAAPEIDGASQNIAIQATNLPTIEDADTFAKNWVEAYRKNSPDLSQALLLLHIGNEIPEQLKWIVVHLDKAQIPYQLKLIDRKNLEDELDQAHVDSAELLKFENNSNSKTNTSSIWQRSKLLLNRIYGLPNGITFWVKLKSTPKQRMIEAATAAFSTIQAGTSLGASLYLLNKTGVHANIIAPVGFLMAWVAANTYKVRPIVKIMTQGRVFKEVGRGDYQVKQSRLFFYTATAIRQFVLNGIIVGAAFGWDQIFQSQQLHSNVENVALGLVAGSWVENWLNSKQASSLPDGTTHVKKGQLTPTQSIVINAVWGTFYYGLVRNLHLLNFGSYGKLTYYVLAAVGTAVTLYEERYWLLDKASALLKAVGIIKTRACETLLILPQTKLSAIFAPSPTLALAIG